MPKLTHSESEQPIEAAPEYVEMYRSQGWNAADEKSDPEGVKPKGK